MQKYCGNSHRCPYGDAFISNRCAYNLDKDDFDCPMIMKNYEFKMDKLCGSQPKEKRARLDARN